MAIEECSDVAEVGGLVIASVRTFGVPRHAAGNFGEFRAGDRKLEPARNGFDDGDGVKARSPPSATRPNTPVRAHLEIPGLPVRRVRRLWSFRMRTS